MRKRRLRSSDCSASSSQPQFGSSSAGTDVTVVCSKLRQAQDTGATSGDEVLTPTRHCIDDGHRDKRCAFDVQRRVGPIIGSIVAQRRALTQTSNTTRKPAPCQRRGIRSSSRVSTVCHWQCASRVPHCAPRVVPECWRSNRCSTGSDGPC